MKISIYSTGQAFPLEGISIAEATQILTNFSSTYESCIDLATKLVVKKAALPPTLRLQSIRSGSLDTILSLDFPMIYATLSPLLPAYASDIISSKSWEIFYKLFEIVSVASKIFKTLGRPATFNFENCQDVIVNYNAGSGTISAPKYMKKILHKSQSDINDLSQLIKQNKIKNINMRSDISPDEVKQFDNFFNLDEDNCEDYSIHEVEELDDSIVEVSCKPYSINKNTGNGRLEYHDGTRWISAINFTIESGNIHDYIDAMKQDSVTFQARRKFMLTTLGERRIAHLYLTGVQA